MTLKEKVGELSWPKTGATPYHAQLGLPDKGCAIKELVVCLVLLNLIRVLTENVFWAKTFGFP